jgi:hypothetical protein
MKIRHYGLLASRHRAEKLKECRRLLLVVNATADLARAATGPACEASEQIKPAALPHCLHTVATAAHGPAVPSDTYHALSLPPPGNRLPPVPPVVYSDLTPLHGDCGSIAD